MSKTTHTILAACIALGSAAAMAQGAPGSSGDANAMPAKPDAMKSMPANKSKDTMGKHAGAMHKDGMKKDGMAKDSMGKDSMAKGAMSKDAMGKEAAPAGSMGGKMTPDPK